MLPPLAEEQLLDLPASLLDLLPVGVCVCDLEGKIIRCNRAAEALWGREPTQADSVMAKVLATGIAVRNTEIVVERPDGTHIVVAMTIDPLRDSAGQLVGAVSCLSDVTPDSTLFSTAGQQMPDLLPGLPPDLLDALPVAVYTTDAAGTITYYNQAAADLWGCQPELGESTFCGSWKLYWPDGMPLPHDQCPMAVALRERRTVRNVEAVAERPDGSRVPFIPFPTPLYDRSGALVGAVNVLVDISDQKRSSRLLTAIVDSSDDAIVTKNLDGVITSWNGGAERLFGYTAAEAVGQHITLLIPADRLDEETGILARLRAGERIDHFETVRQHKDGSPIDISLTVSPVKSENGVVIGASKVARNITERRQALERQQLLLREMNHRVKNLFALASGVVMLSARSTQSIKELALAVNERLSALARAQSLTLPDLTADGSLTERTATLHDLLRTILSPYETRDAAQPRLAIEGIDLALSGGSVTSFALLFNEFATNAAKYGSLSTAEGTVAVVCSEQGNMVHIRWTERGGPPIDAPGRERGFGSILVEATVAQLGGEISREWEVPGLTIKLSAARDRCVAPPSA